MKSWLPKLGGVLTAFGFGLKSGDGLPPWVHGVGDLLTALGPLIIGLFARQNNVTSEQVNAGKK